MATIEDIVAQLVKRTESGDIEWESFYWTSDGTPAGWAATEGGCRFSVITDPVSLSISGPPQIKNLTEVGRGEQISGLVEVLQTKFGERTATKDETLAIALDCLMGHSAE